MLPPAVRADAGADHRRWWRFGGIAAAEQAGDCADAGADQRTGAGGWGQPGDRWSGRYFGVTAEGGDGHGEASDLQHGLWYDLGKVGMPARPKGGPGCEDCQDGHHEREELQAGERAALQQPWPQFVAGSNDDSAHLVTWPPIRGCGINNLPNYAAEAIDQSRIRISTKFTPEIVSKWTSVVVAEDRNTGGSGGTCEHQPAQLVAAQATAVAKIR